MKTIFTSIMNGPAFLVLVGFFLSWLPTNSFALPPPPSLKELCQRSNTIVLGKYVGGIVGEPKDCQFWVTYQIKPKKFYKKPSDLGDMDFIQFKKRYFVDNKSCAKLPGPNAVPESLAAELKKPGDEKKIFFLQATGEKFFELSDVFWAIVKWKEAPEAWHKEFKETPECHGL